MANLTAEQIASIENYGNEIITMKNDIEAIKQTFAMYIGGRGNHGYMTLVREIYDNAIDQLIDKTSPCNYIMVEFDERDYKCTITDNGKGIPFDDMVRIFTKNHTSKNYVKEKGSGDWSIGINGVGSKAVNALSRSYIAESYKYNGDARRIEFIDGYPTTEKPVKIPNPKKFQGTKISFVPGDILGDINIKWDHVYNLVRDIFALTDTGNKLDFIAIDRKGEIHKENITNTDGIMYFLIKNTKSPIVMPIEVLENTGNERSHMVFTWDSSSLNEPGYKETVVAFCNYCPIIDEGSTNITGTLKGITSWFCDYMNKIYLANSRAKTRVIPNDVKTGLVVAIDSDMLNPEFSGQAKEKLSNEEMDPFCKEVVMRGLDEWSKTNPNDLQKVAKFIYSIAQVRERADKEKVKISANYESSAFSGLPAKYVKPTGKDHLELFICEGDSAKGPIVKCRDTVHQAIFPIRGKIINAFSHSAKEVFNNAEVQGILNILFGKKVYGPQNIRDLKLEDCKFEKVVFASDADADRQNCPKMLFPIPWG